MKLVLFDLRLTDGARLEPAVLPDEVDALLDALLRGEPLRFPVAGSAEPFVIDADEIAALDISDLGD